MCCLIGTNFTVYFQEIYVAKPRTVRIKRPCDRDGGQIQNDLRILNTNLLHSICHDDVIKWKHLPRYWPFVRGIHRSPVNSPPKGQWRGALMFSLICVWINGWVHSREAGDLRRYGAHHHVTVMLCHKMTSHVILKPVPVRDCKVSSCIVYGNSMG